VAAWQQQWNAIEKPPGWSRLPNPISHRGSFMFSDTLRLAMIMPFVLWRFLSPEHLKTDKLEAIKSRLNLWHRREVCSKLVQLWAVEANALRLAFRTSFDEADYEKLGVALEKERDALLEVRCTFIATRSQARCCNDLLLFFSVCSCFRLSLRTCRTST
jgi:hypothetical protein